MTPEQMAELAARLRDPGERFIFQGNSLFALRLADQLDSMVQRVADMTDDVNRVERENERLLNKLNALLMLVSKKYPGETRYETACRYIREAGNQEVSGLKHDLTRATKENK